MKTILATAYAINPYKGSEDGMGWNFVCQIARFQHVFAVTRENNQNNIEKYISANPDPIYENITFLYFDTPYWMRFWKKGGRGALLYYWLWQRMVVSFIKKKDLKFDIVHNLNFHNDWTPSHLWRLGKPFVWGPIGHHPLIPQQYLSPYKKAYFIKDCAAWFIKRIFWSISPALSATIDKADHILCMNTSVSEVLSLMPGKYSIMPSVATEDFGFERDCQRNKFTLLSAGRLVPLKGFDLTILAFADFISKLSNLQKQNCELILVGSGPEKEYLQKIVSQKGIESYVSFIPWIDRNDLLDIYKRTSIFLFPSHEGAGMVVAEALSFGVPIICLDNCGPGEFINDNCGFAIKNQPYQQTVEELSSAIAKLHGNPELLFEMQANARKRFETHFHWNNRGEQLHSIYQNL